VLSDDVPSYRSYPPGLMVKLLALRIAMALGRWARGMGRAQRNPSGSTRGI